MARNVDARLSSLRARRTGLDRLGRVPTMDSADLVTKSFVEESYQRRATGQPNTRYALGAMQEVGPDYTRISRETAARVEAQLAHGLHAQGRAVGFRLQGSVPLNIHIRGVSDVDLLALDEAFHTYDRGGRREQLGLYTSPINYTPLSALLSLRGHVETILTAKYPAATVDKTGSKAVKIFGGSLPRPVDVVPSHWHDTHEYQATGVEHSRGVCICDRQAYRIIENLPFKHNRLVHERDSLTGGNLRKTIRLCKNVKADAIEEGTEIDLPSFDIAAVMYHADVNVLRSGAYYELDLLAETQRWLDTLARNIAYARTLKTPDGGRFIIDKNDKAAGLIKLSIEIDDLLHEVAKEQNSLIGMAGEPTFEYLRESLRSRPIY